MRFMVIVKADRTTEAGTLPSAKDLEVMGKFNEELVKAGALVDAPDCSRHRKAPGSRAATASCR